MNDLEWKLSQLEEFMVRMAEEIADTKMLLLWYDLERMASCSCTSNMKKVKALKRESVSLSRSCQRGSSVSFESFRSVS